MLLRMASGLAFAVLLSAQVGDYGGPSILGRGLSPSVSNPNTTISFRPHISVDGFCDTALTGASINAQGQLSNTGACGIEGAAGIYGSHTWKHTTLGLNYAGDYRHYPNAQSYDGTDQTLGLGVTHQVTKHVALRLQADAGTYKRNFLGVPALVGVEANVISIPSTQVLDSRLEYGGTSGGLTMQLSSRLSFDVGGEAFAVRYQVPYFFGTTGLGAHGDLVYRYSRYGSIGVSYQFRHFGFTNSFGATDMHIASLVYSLRLSKVWELQAQVGAARLETLGLERIEVNPVVAAITGQTSGIVAAYHLNYVPSYAMNATRTFARGTLSMGVSRSVTPGNGVYLTSSFEGAGIGYSHNPIHHFYFTATAGFSQLVSQVQTLPRYRTYTAGAGISRTLGKGLGFSTRLDYRYFDIGSLIFKRDAYRATVGLSWSPGDLPLVLW